MPGDPGGAPDLFDQYAVLCDVARRLRAAGIDHMLVGALAAGLYAEPRMTRDLDIVMVAGPQDLRHLQEAFEPEYYVPEEGAREALTGRGMFNVIHRTRVMKVDLIVQKDGAWHRQAMERRRRVALDECEVDVATIEDVVLAKLDWARESLSEFQLRDVRALLAEPHDRDYIERWVLQLGLARVWEMAST